MSSRYPGGLIRKNAANTAVTGASGVWDLGSQAQAVKNNTWPISGLALPVSGSLRFKSSASAYLNRTPASAGNRKTWTWSAWIKRAAIGSGAGSPLLFMGGTGLTDTTGLGIAFGTDDKLYVQGYNTNFLATTQVFRDPSAWYHIMVVMNSTNATANNRLRVYVNGSEVTDFSTRNNLTQNTDYGINQALLHTVGYEAAAFGYSYFDGYMCEINFVDSQALTPASFGQTSPITGVWEPIKYTGTYGTNGFYLSLSDTSSIGKDFSGNGNNWTPNNFSTTSGETFDLMRDVPVQWTPQGVTDVGGVVRGNYATWNPAFYRSNESLSNGNLSCTTGTAGGSIGTIAVSTGKWYWETINPTTTATARIAGIINHSLYANDLYEKSIYIQANGKYSINNGADVTYGSSYALNDIIGVALDADAQTVIFYLNGVAQGSAISLTSVYSAGQFVVPAITQSGGASRTHVINFGQRPFSYTPPSGYKSLCTTNLSTPTIGATTTTAANKYFDALIYTGNGSSSQRTDISWTNMQPDMVWIKNRTTANNHVLHDVIRGPAFALQTNLTDATDGPVGFGSDGFGSDTGVANQLRVFTNDGRYNLNNNSYVAWGWKGTSSNTTNTSGSITSIVRANQTAGFSIVTFTAPSGSTAYTVGHGLGTTPAMIIVKERSAAGNNWYVWHQRYSNTAQGNQRLDTTAAVGNSTQVWNNTAPTSTVFSSISGTAVSSSTTAVAYCFAEIAGYSAFGSYTGNGSTNGPFVYTGFRPKYVLIKRTDAIATWYVYDTARATYNTTNAWLRPNTTDAENSATTWEFDLLSNGFKVRNSGAFSNASSGTYIYAAFAEFPFKTALAR